MTTQINEMVDLSNLLPVSYFLPEWILSYTSDQRISPHVYPIFFFISFVSLSIFTIKCISLKLNKSHLYKDEVCKYHSQNFNMQLEINLFNKEISNEEEQNNIISENLSSLQQRIKLLSKPIKELKLTNTKWKEKLIALEKQYDDQEKNIENYEPLITKFENEKEIEEVTYIELQDKITKFESDLEQDSNEIMELQSSIKKLNEYKENENEVEQLEQKLITLENENADISKTCEDSLLEKTTLKQENEELEEIIQALMETIKSLKSFDSDFQIDEKIDITKCKINLEEIEKHNSEMLSEIKKMTEENESKSLQFEELEKEISNLKEKYQSLLDSKQEIEGKIILAKKISFEQESSSHSQLALLQVSKQEGREKIADVENLIKGIESKKQELSTQIKEIEAEITERNAKYEISLAELDSKFQETCALEINLKRELAETERELEYLKQIYTQGNKARNDAYEKDFMVPPPPPIPHFILNEGISPAKSVSIDMNESRDDAANNPSFNKFEQYSQFYSGQMDGPLPTPASNINPYMFPRMPYSSGDMFGHFAPEGYCPRPPMYPSNMPFLPPNERMFSTKPPSPDTILANGIYGPPNGFFGLQQFDNRPFEYYDRQFSYPNDDQRSIAGSDISLRDAFLMNNFYHQPSPSNVSINNECSHQPIPTGSFKPIKPDKKSEHFERIHQDSSSIV